MWSIKHSIIFFNVSRRLLAERHFPLYDTTEQSRSQTVVLTVFPKCREYSFVEHNKKRPNDGSSDCLVQWGVEANDTYFFSGRVLSLGILIASEPFEDLVSSFTNDFVVLSQFPNRWKRVVSKYSMSLTHVMWISRCFRTNVTSFDFRRSHLSIDSAYFPKCCCRVFLRAKGYQGYRREIFWSWKSFQPLSGIC